MFCFFLGPSSSMNGSVRPAVYLSVCPSVCHTFLTFLRVITQTEVTSMQKFKVRGKKVKVTEVNTQLSRFRTVPQVWIHKW